MGNLRRLGENQDFGKSEFGSDEAKSFGFTGSAEGYDEHPAAPPFAGSKPTDNGKHFENYAEGGEVHEGEPHHKMAHHHPHGHHVTHVEHGPHGTIMHHAHGGYTHHHPDGGVSHHHHDGQPVHHMAHGGHHPGEGTFLARAHGGDMEQDRAMVAKGVHQHEDHEHHGEHTDLHLAQGGGARHPHIPSSEKPLGGRGHSPINTAPRNPMRNPSSRNAMPGGQMGYGVEPSAEPDVADGGGEPTPMAHGGKAPHKRHHSRH